LTAQQPNFPVYHQGDVNMTESATTRKRPARDARQCNPTQDFAKNPP
jgi:hypothetical protein